MASKLIETSRIIIDHRERKLIEQIAKGVYGFQPLCKDLPIGDIWIYKNPVAIDSPEIPDVILERKTLNDLISSINDGRYHEQKYRILKHRDTYNRKYGYIVEITHDKWRDYSHKTNESRIKGSIVNTILRDNIFVLISISIEDTCAYLKKLLDNAPKYLEQTPAPSINAISANASSPDVNISNDAPEITESTTNTIAESAPSQPENDYIKSISFKKKDHLTPTICYLAQLCQIPKVSTNIAQEICNRYPNMASLLMAYTSLKTEKERENLLSEIMINKRRIGKLSATIYRNLYGIDSPAI